MRYLRLVWASLFRKKTRTVLTMLSIFSAFLLFGLLTAVDVLFNTPPGGESGATRLVTQARTSFTQSLPVRMAAEIESIPGVRAVSWRQWFGSYYQEPQNQIVGFVVPPERFLPMFTEWKLTAAEQDAFRNTRTGILVGRGLADRFGWKLGDKVPIQSNIFPQKDGSKTWTFDVVGIFDGIDEDYQRQTANQLFINYAYFDEANQFGQGLAGIFNLKVDDPAQVAEVAAAIDARFLNSANETKTQTESEFQLGFARQIGDIGLIVNASLSAVLFTILLLTANTMAQSVRERIPELAVLKCLGFTDRRVLALVLAEALLLCSLGAGLGMALAFAALAALPSEYAAVRIGAEVWAIVAASVLLLALATGLPPAWRAMRLSIVDALAGR
jgi:putative ABC transport system permease protein